MNMQWVSKKQKTRKQGRRETKTGMQEDELGKKMPAPRFTTEKLMGRFFLMLVVGFFDSQRDSWLLSQFKTKDSITRRGDSESPSSVEDQDLILPFIPKANIKENWEVQKNLDTKIQWNQY